MPIADMTQVIVEGLQVARQATVAQVTVAQAIEDQVIVDQVVQVEKDLLVDL